MNNDKTRLSRVRYGVLFLIFAVQVGVEAQIPGPSSDPQVLVGALPGDASVDNTGSSSYSIPLAVPAGTAGVQPTLAIAYSSRGGNGSLGLGFYVDGFSSVTRVAPDRMHEGLFGAIDFDEDDRLWLDGQRLLMVSTGTPYGGDGSEYRTEIETFQAIVLHGEMNGSNAWFEVRTKSGLIYEYGKTLDSCVEPSNRYQAVSWAVNRISDTVGNYMEFIYDEDVANGEHLLERIDYTGNTNSTPVLVPYNTVDFVYESRDDVRYRYQKGARFNATKRLERVEFNVDGNLVHEYRLEYDYGVVGVSQLSSVQQFFANGDSVPPTVFEWTDADGSPGFVADVNFTPPAEITATDGTDKGTGLVDLNGDGLTDFLWCNPSGTGAYTNSGSGFVSAPSYAQIEYNAGITENPLRFTDFNGDGVVDLVVHGWLLPYTYINTGSGWDTNSIAQTLWYPDVEFFVDEADSDNAGRFFDIDNDGKTDYLLANGERNTPLFIPVAAKSAALYTDGSNWYDISSSYAPSYPFTVDINGIMTPIGVQSPDLDGDGRQDMIFRRTNGDQGAYLNTGTNWSASVTAYEPPYPMHDDTYGNLNVQIIDVNGDGLPDFLFHRQFTDGTTTNGAYLNTGSGWATSSTASFIPPMPLSVDDSDYDDAEGIALVDLNGDGLVDIGWNNSTDSGAWINSGTGWVTNDLYAPKYPLATTSKKDNGGRFVDINGDGLTDQVYRRGAEQGAWINQSKIPLLKKITKGRRSETEYATITELFYSPLTDKDVYIKGSGATYPTYDIQTATKVVSEMSKDNGLGGLHWSMYTYSNARTHRWRGFLGFQIFESYDPQTKISQIEYLAQDFPLTGSQLKSETRYIPDPDNDPDGQLLKEVENIWLYNAVWSGNILPDYPLFLYTPKSTERKWELGGTTPISEVSSYTWFDLQDDSSEYPALVQRAWNDLTDELRCGHVAKIMMDYGGGLRQISENSYIYDYSRWLLGRLSYSTNTFVKTGYPDIVRNSSFQYYGSHGMLGLETLEPSGNKQLQTLYEYDSFGNITNKSIYGADIISRSEQRTTYDAKGRYVVESKNALNHSETMLTDAATGLLKSRTGPNSLPTSWQYDAFGHQTLETRADTTTTSTIYEWDSSVTVNIPLANGGTGVAFTSDYAVTTESSGAAPAKVYYDRQGRGIRVITEAPDGRKVYRDTGYNALGQKTTVSDPYFSGETPDYGFTEYDVLGRSKIVIAPDGTKTAFGYSGLVSTVTNNFGATDGAAESRNQVFTTYKNTKGETLKVVDNLGYEISYDYDAVGNLVGTTDENSNTIVMEYDIRGHKIRQDDPDMGEWFYAYNVLGQMVAQTNANMQIATMQYDALGRMTNSISPEGVSEWFYDGNGQDGWLGALKCEDLYDVSGTNLIYRRTHAYDVLGRPLLSLHNVDNKWYYTCNAYDEYSRVKSSYRFWRPQSVIQSGNQLDHNWNSFESINTYNSRGAITKVTDGTGHIWWEIDEADFDAKGHLLEYKLGNDVVTTHEFNPDTGRVEEIQLSSMTHGLSTYGFQYDRLGNLTDRSLTRTMKTNLSESFAYDKLNRLVGVDDASSFVVYDAIGNIQSKIGISGTYQYGAGNAGPHAVTTADGVTYSYDNCGNMLGRYEGGTNISSTAWTSFNKPSTLYNGHDGSEFTYDINNNRIMQISFESGAGTKKLYLGGFEQEETLTGDQYDRANWQWTHKETRVFVSTPSGVIGIHVQDSSENVERKYLHKNHLGSIVAVTGEGSGGSAAIRAEYSYDSWGKRRSADTWLTAAVDTSSLETDRGYTGHEMLDHLGLIHMNGRIYDSNIGRFLSADPIVQAPADLQSYNRYSYVRNNPLSLTDPSGFSWWSDNVTGPVSDFMDKYWVPILITIVAVVITVATFGAAGPAVGAVLPGVWGGIATGAIAGAAGGFVAGFSSSIAYGGDLSDAFDNGLKGALWGGVSGALAGGIGHYAKAAEWSAKARALAHGLRGGLVSLGQGDSFKAGFLAGSFSSFAGNDIILATVAGGTASVIGGGKFMNGAVSSAAAAAAAATFSGGFTIQRSLSLVKTLADDMYTGIRGFVWDKPIAMGSGLRDVWNSNHNFAFKSVISIAKIGQHLIVPTQGPWLGADFGKYNLSPEQQDTDGSQYISSMAPKTQNASARHDFDVGSWRHARWVGNTWVGPGVEPGLFGQVYRAAGTIVFPVISVLEASAFNH